MLITHRSGYHRDFRRRVITLEAELHRLAGLDAGIPAQVARRVRIAAGEVSVPGATQGGAIGIFPAHIPAINRTGTFVGNTDRTHKTRAPVIHNHITAVTRGCSATRHRTG